MGRTYRVHKTGKFLPESKVSRDEKDRKYRATFFDIFVEDICVPHLKR